MLERILLAEFTGKLNIVWLTRLCAPKGLYDGFYDGALFEIQGLQFEQSHRGEQCSSNNVKIETR